jgi:hypothetical protein
MKRILMRKTDLLAIFALALPIAAFADGSVDFGNEGGTLTGSSAGLSLNSTLIAVDGWGSLGRVVGADLGSVTFSTGALTSGSLQMGGTFAGGGSLTINSTGTQGLPGGVLFTGSFTGPVTWTMSTAANGTHAYVLSGLVTGTYANGTSGSGIVNLTVLAGKGYFNGSMSLTDRGSGDTIIGTVPEPGTLGLLGTGLLGLAGLLHRKLKG